MLYRVELYNRFDERCRWLGNGYMVARYLDDGRRCNTIQQFEGDKEAAQAFCDSLNQDKI